MRTGRTGIVGQQELIPRLFRFAAVRHSQCRINGIRYSVFIISDRLHRRGFCAVLANRMYARFQLRQHLGHVQCDGILHRLIQRGLVMFAEAVCRFQHAMRSDVPFCGRRSVNLHIAVPVICRISQRNAVTDTLKIHGHAGEIGQCVPRRLCNYHIAVCISTVILQIVQRNIRIDQCFSVYHLAMQYDLLDLCLLQQVLTEQDFRGDQSAGSVILIGIQTGNVQCCRTDLGNAVVGNHKTSRRGIVIQGNRLRIVFLHQITDHIFINAYAGQCRFRLFCADNSICLCDFFRLRNPLALAVLRCRRRLVIVHFVRGVDLVVICPQVRKCTTHGNQTVELGIAWDLLPKYKFYLVTECQTILVGQHVADFQCPVLFFCHAGIGILFQMQPQFAGSLIDHIAVCIGKAKPDKLVDVCSVYLEPVFQLNVRIMHCVIFQADLNFLKTKIFRHMVCRNCVKYRDITDTVKPVQIVFIYCTDTHCLVWHFDAVCVLDILVVSKILPCVRSEVSRI